ncbi:hypothetical protein BE843_13280 [Legionella pneumophila subsp. pneumophila]|nr:hypothetical protein BE843_13280 [Legionella pneumophila subsp. pneumophila]AOW60644.1 hypothetical protein BE844_05490 [Legionella pneumophila subsp. pneumophila]AOW66041.1 hypothetical protein BE846_03255 [Legionella pneumophila subsp. pneumophila]
MRNIQTIDFKLTLLVDIMIILIIQRPLFRDFHNELQANISHRWHPGRRVHFYPSLYCINPAKTGVLAGFYDIFAKKNFE